MSTEESQSPAANRLPLLLREISGGVAVHLSSAKAISIALNVIAGPGNDESDSRLEELSAETLCALTSAIEAHITAAEGLLEDHDAKLEALRGAQVKLPPSH